MNGIEIESGASAYSTKVTFNGQVLPVFALKLEANADRDPVLKAQITVFVSRLTIKDIPFEVLSHAAPDHWLRRLWWRLTAWAN